MYFATLLGNGRWDQNSVTDASGEQVTMLSPILFIPPQSEQIFVREIRLQYMCDILARPSKEIGKLIVILLLGFLNPA